MKTIHSISKLTILVTAIFIGQNSFAGPSTSITCGPDATCNDDRAIPAGSTDISDYLPKDRRYSKAEFSDLLQAHRCPTDKVAAVTDEYFAKIMKKAKKGRGDKRYTPKINYGGVTYFDLEKACK